MFLEAIFKLNEKDQRLLSQTDDPRDPKCQVIGVEIVNLQNSSNKDQMVILHLMVHGGEDKKPDKFFRIFAKVM